MTQIKVLCVVACLAVVFVPRLQPQTTTPEPVAELKSLVGPVGELLANHPQRKAVSMYFGAVAESLDRDAAGPKYLKTCESLRVWNEVAEQRFRGELSPKITGLSDKLNAVFVGWVGDDSAKMDAEKYRKAAEAARAIEWATSK